MAEEQLNEQRILRIHWMLLALRLPQGGVKSVFHSIDQCKDRMMAVRWSDGLNCPKCSSTDIAPESPRKIFRCRKCQYHHSAMAGTFAHGAHKELLRYFLASEDIINCHANLWHGLVKVCSADFSAV